MKKIRISSFLEQKFSALSEMTVTYDCAEEILNTVLSILQKNPISEIGNRIRNLRWK